MLGGSAAKSRYDPPALNYVAREERGRGCKEPTLYGGVLVHCAVYTGDVLKIPNVFWSQCVCTVHSPALSRTWLFGKMVITYQFN